MPDDGTVEAITSTLEAEYGSASVSTIWSDRATTPRQTPRDPVDSLTDKQREVLQYAFHVGYFESPREVSATELADQLGIARATLTQHLRAAQRKLFEALLSG